MRDAGDVLARALVRLTGQRLGHARMQRAPLGDGHVRVRHLVGQRVPKGVLGVGSRRRLVHELRRLQPLEPVANRIGRHVGDRLQERAREVFADDSRRRQ